MLKRREIPDCPFEISLMLMGDRLKAIIVYELLSGTKRFTELKKSISENAVSGISQKVLTDHLRIMEEHELVRREVFAEIPPRVEYSLTEFGQGLRPIIEGLWNWGENYKNSHI